MAQAVFFVLYGSALDSNSHVVLSSSLALKLKMSAASGAPKIVLGDVITTDLANVGVVVLVMAKRKKSGMYKAYLMGVKDKSYKGELCRKIGKSIQISFVTEKVVPDPILSEKEVTVFINKFINLDQGDKMDISALNPAQNGWMTATEFDVLIDKAAEVLEVPDEIEQPEDEVKKKTRAKATVLNNPLFYL